MIKSNLSHGKMKCYEIVLSWCMGWLFIFLKTTSSRAYSDIADRAEILRKFDHGLMFFGVSRKYFLHKSSIVATRLLNKIFVCIFVMIFKEQQISK